MAKQLHELILNYSSPVLIFLSDGECLVPEREMYDICRRAVTLGWVSTTFRISIGD
jgi:hypothetical protein